MNNLKTYNVLLITTAFPYLPGEQFLETEIEYFQKCDGINLTIMPSQKSDHVRPIDPSIEIAEYLASNSYAPNNNKYFSVVKNIFSKYFYHELIHNGLFNIGKLKAFDSSMNSYKYYYALFDNYFKDKVDLERTVIYTYWHTELTYALQNLKSKYNYKLVSRIHGYDLYQERKAYNYVPLKKQFTENIDKVFTITLQANDYMQTRYGFNPDILELGRLGVDDKGIITLPTKQNTLHIVSCSFLTQVKRIDKIIEALEKVSKVMPNVRYIWTHIGEGELYVPLLKMANDKLGNIENVHFKFLGNLDNQEVYQFYNINEVDVFINVSESEGVPVSIMEAMSCHIPIVAPDIGGVSDMLIDGLNGYLLSSESKIDEIVEAIKEVFLYKNQKTRSQSYNIYLEKYNAKTNYILFLENLKNILDEK